MSSSNAPWQQSLFPEMEDLATENGSLLSEPANPPLAMGSLVNQYRIEDVIGEGAAGVVYRASDIRLGRQVALKLLKHELQADMKVWRRLLREARAVSRLNHPGFCAIYDLGEDNGRAYIAMEYVEGRLLRDLVAGGRLPKEQVSVYGAQIAAALAHAHQRGVIHRDVKSSNIIVKPNGVVKLLDFGLALRLRTNSRGKKMVTSVSQYEAAIGGGTLAYAAPEILRGKRASVQSDLWSLGVVLYEMATGKLPFTGRTCFEMSLGIMTKSPEPLPRDTDSRLSAIISRCLEKDRVDRYAAAQEVFEDMQRVLLTPASSPVKRLLNFWSAGAH